MLEKIDLFLFQFINHTLANPFFDWLMPLFDKPKSWIPLILILWLAMAYKDQKCRKMLLILVPLTILCCDQFGGLIKDFGLRDRPWFALGLENVRHLGGMGGKHSSFPSNHASNISGIAFLFSFIYPHLRRYFWGFAILIMFSRVYIGVHYPLDVFTGFMLGTLISCSLVIIYKKVTSDGTTK
jgi:undecaprenyl-diphosphatase